MCSSSSDLLVCTQEGAVSAWGDAGKCSPKTLHPSSPKVLVQTGASQPAESFGCCYRRQSLSSSSAGREVVASPFLEIFQNSTG